MLRPTCYMCSCLFINLISGLQILTAQCLFLHVHADVRTETVTRQQAHLPHVDAGICLMLASDTERGVQVRCLHPLLPLLVFHYLFSVNHRLRNDQGAPQLLRAIRHSQVVPNSAMILLQLVVLQVACLLMRAGQQLCSNQWQLPCVAMLLCSSTCVTLRSNKLTSAFTLHTHQSRVPLETLEFMTSLLTCMSCVIVCCADQGCSRQLGRPAPWSRLSCCPSWLHFPAHQGTQSRSCASNTVQDPPSPNPHLTPHAAAGMQHPHQAPGIRAYGSPWTWPGVSPNMHHDAPSPHPDVSCTQWCPKC